MTKIAFWLRAWLLPVLFLVLAAAVLTVSAFTLQPSSDSSQSGEAGSGYIPLGVADREAELRALSILRGAGFSVLISPTSSVVPLSNYLTADLVPLEELRALPKSDPRYTPWIDQLESWFYDGERRLVFFGWEGERPLFLARLAELALENADEHGDLPWTMESSASPAWFRLVCLLLASAALVLLNIGRSGAVPALVLGGIFIAGAAVLGTRLHGWEAVLLFAICASRVLRDLAEISSRDLGDPFWFRWRRLSATLLRNFHIRRVVVALPAELRILLLATAGFGLLLLILLPADIWSLSLLGMLVLSTPLFLQAGFGAAVATQLGRSHRAFAFVPLEPAPARRLLWFRAAALACLVGLAVPVAVQLSRSLPGSSPLSARGAEANLSVELGMRHAFFQAWFGYGARWDDVGPGAEVKLPRFERQAAGYRYTEQLLASYDEWTARLLPESADPLRLALAAQGGSLAPADESGVYSGAGGRTGTLVLFLALAVAAAIPPCMELIRMRTRSLPRFALAIKKVPAKAGDS